MLKQHIKTLDGIRGLAALYVLVHHCRLMLTQSYHEGLGLHPEKYQWYDKLMVYFFGLFKYGHEAVIVFFVLSGFVIHLKQAVTDSAFSNLKLGQYFKRRILRIYPTLLVSFALCLLLDVLLSLITKESLTQLFSKYNTESFVYNLLLIPESQTWGYNHPIWSLKHEWFFYLIYPLLLWLDQKNTVFPILVVFALYISFCFGLSIPYIGQAAYTLLIWCLGFVLAVLYSKNLLIKYLPYLTLLLFIYLFINRENTSLSAFIDVTFALVVTGIFATVLSNRVPPINRFLNKISRLGAFSYSLYLLHVPLIYFMLKLMAYFTGSAILPYHLWYVLLASVVIPFIIYLIYYVTERLVIKNLTAKQLP